MTEYLINLMVLLNDYICAGLFDFTAINVARLSVEIIFTLWVFVQVVKNAQLFLYNPCHYIGKTENLFALLQFGVLGGLCAMWFFICINGELFEPSIGADVDAQVTQQAQILSIGKVQRFHNYLNLCCMALMIVRMLGHFQFHRRLAIVTSTISNAAIDLLHVGIVFAFIVIIYAFAGYTLIGRQSASFSGANAISLPLHIHTHATQRSNTRNIISSRHFMTEYFTV